VKGEEAVTVLLEAMQRGDATAGEKLVPILYTELHRLARGYMRRERANHTLQPTALINEAFVRLAQDTPSAQSRAHFVALAANVMRRVLVDHARTRVAGRHGGGQQKLPLEEGLAFSEQQPRDMIALNDALDRLEKTNSRQAKVVELRFFGGFSVEEIASILGIAPRSVKRDWALARVWLHKEISRS
jgi:RNA polymerase sigma-70 factor, ECF subfamily